MGLVFSGGLVAMSVCTLTEVICWVDALDQKPDADTTVLVFGEELADRTWLGYWDDEAGQWKSPSNLVLEGVTHWAEQPIGPE